MKRIAWESLDARERTQALRRPAQQASAGTSAVHHVLPIGLYIRNSEGKVGSSKYAEM